MNVRPLYSSINRGNRRRYQFCTSALKVAVRPTVAAPNTLKCAATAAPIPLPGYAPSPASFARRSAASARRLTMCRPRPASPITRPAPPIARAANHPSRRRHRPVLPVARLGAAPASSARRLATRGRSPLEALSPAHSDSAPPLAAARPRAANHHLRRPKPTLGAAPRAPSRCPPSPASATHPRRCL
jgi:hypothetical protein